MGFGSDHSSSKDPLQVSGLSTAVTEGVLEMEPSISTVLWYANKNTSIVGFIQQGEIWQCEYQLHSTVL